MVKREKPKVLKKHLDLLILTTLSIKQNEIDAFLSEDALCLHVIVLEGAYVTTTSAEKIAKTVIVSEFDTDEYAISPVATKIIALTEQLRKNIILKFENLETKIDSLEVKISEMNTDLETKIDSLEVKISEMNADLETKIGEMDTTLQEILKLLKK